MTPEHLIHRHLSLHHWGLRIILPTMLMLLLFLTAFGMVSEAPRFRDNNATIVGFFAFYYVLVRGGHIIMIRSLHKDLMRNHAEAYLVELAAVDPVVFRKKTIGGTLAQIKRRIVEQAKPNSRKSQ